MHPSLKSSPEILSNPILSLDTSTNFLKTVSIMLIAIALACGLYLPPRSSLSDIVKWLPSSNSSIFYCFLPWILPLDYRTWNAASLCFWCCLLIYWLQVPWHSVIIKPSLLWGLVGWNTPKSSTCWYGYAIWYGGRLHESVIGALFSPRTNEL